LPCCGMPAAAGRHVIPQMTRRPVVMTDDGRDRFRCLTGWHSVPRPAPTVPRETLRPSKPDPGASLAVYPGLPRRPGVDHEDDRGDGRSR
jgi:hypothetical protein